MKIKPLGLKSRENVVSERMNDISVAVQRYIDAELDVPQEWVTEYFELFEWYRNYNWRIKDE